MNCESETEDWQSVTHGIGGGVDDIGHRSYMYLGDFGHHPSLHITLFLLALRSYTTPQDSTTGERPGPLARTSCYQLPSTFSSILEVISLVRPDVDHPIEPCRRDASETPPTPTSVATVENRVER
jgi:hypothetical protein